MPYKIRKAKCKQSDGDKGSYVLSYVDNKGKRHRNCHTSKRMAKAQIAAIEMPESKGQHWVPLARRIVEILNEELASFDLGNLRESHDPEDEVSHQMAALTRGEEIGFLYDEESEEEAARLADELIAGDIGPEDVPLHLAMNVTSWLRDHGPRGEKLRNRVLHHHRHGLGGVAESRSRRLIEAALKPDSEKLKGAIFEFSKVFADLIKLNVWSNERMTNQLGELVAKKIDDPDLPCEGAWEISWAKSSVDGLGPLMYDAMMEYVSPDPLTSDRISVSDEARRVWRYYFQNRKDVTPVQLDNENGELTPRKKSDDCNQTAAYFTTAPDEDDEGNYARKGKDGKYEPAEIGLFYQSPLSKAYKSKGTPTLDALKKLNMLR